MTPTLQPSAKQDLGYRILADNHTSFMLFGGGAGGGKSWFGCEWLLTNCYRYPGTKWFIARKELKRLMASTYLTWVKVTRFHNIPDGDWKLNSQYNYIEFVAGAAKGSRIDLLDVAHQPQDPLYERFGSLEFTGGWGEEVGEWEFMAFDVLKTRIGRHLNDKYNLKPPKFLLTCNPTQNWLYRIFYKPFRNGTLSMDYAFVQSLYKDNPFSRDIYGEQLDKITDRVLRARLRDGMWEYSSDDLALIQYDAIVEMFSNVIDESPTKYFSADIARFGSDKIVYGCWRGLDLYKLEERTKQAQTKTEEDIRDFMLKEFISYQNAIVDEDGMGGGIVDHLAGINGFMGNRSAFIKPEDDVLNRYENIPTGYLTRPNYKNLRSQCYFMLADMINTHKLKLSAEIGEAQREMIVEELQQIKRVDDNPDAPLQIAPKDEIKEAIGRSPDYADTLMMRMYFEVSKIERRPEYNEPDMERIRASGKQNTYGGIGWDRSGLAR
jgi:hypothetical protein